MNPNCRHSIERFITRLAIRGMRSLPHLAVARVLILLLMAVVGFESSGQTPLTGNINWNDATQNKTYKLSSCDQTYTITKSSSTADVNGSYMNFQLPDGAAENGCKIKITMEDCDMAAYNGLFNRQRDKLTLTSNGVSNAEWYESGGLWVFTDEPIGAEFEGGIGQDVKITLTNSSSGLVGTSWWKISVTCTGCCEENPILVTCPPANMVSGTTHNLNPSGGSGSYTYTVNPNNVATVNNSGMVTARQPGSATITITSPAGTVNGIKYCATSTTCPITVVCKEHGGTFAFNGTESTITANETLNLNSLLYNTTGQPVQWSSGNTTVATIINGGVNSGEVTGHVGGTAIITATIPQWTSGNITYCSKSVEYTVNVVCGNISITPCDSTDANGICYTHTCAGESITLGADVSHITGAQNYSWIYNAHDGTGDHSGGNGSTCTITPPVQQGIDVTLTVLDGNNCPSRARTRIKVGGGITAADGSLPDINMGNICVGDRKCIAIGSETSGENSIQINQPAVNVASNLSHVESTPAFIENCGSCYTSTINVTEYGDGQRISENADEFKHLMLRIEHSRINDLNIKLSCPSGREITILNNPNPAGRYLYLGLPEDDDPSNLCSSASNASGTGWTYCFSNAGGNILNTGNHQDGIAAGTYVLKPSNMTTESQYYTPADNFTGLAGCPLNGNWILTICDNVLGNNGHIFEWQLGLESEGMANVWSFENTVANSRLSCNGVTTSSTSTELCVEPQPGQSSGTCSLVLIDNIGCENNINNSITFAFDSAWVNLTSGTPNQSYCYGDVNMSSIGYTYGGKATGVTVQWIKDGSEIGRFNSPNTNTTTTNTVYGITTAITRTGDFAGTVTHGGTPTAPGIYTCDIWTTQGDPCVSNHKYDTIRVWPKPTVNAVDDQLICNGSPSPVTLEATGSGGSGPLTYTWTPGSLIGASVSVSPDATTTYTVTAADEHCSATDQVQVTVSNLDAEIQITNP